MTAFCFFREEGFARIQKYITFAFAKLLRLWRNW